MVGALALPRAAGPAALPGLAELFSLAAQAAEAAAPREAVGADAADVRASLAGDGEAYERLVKSDVKYRFCIDMASLKSE